MQLAFDLKPEEALDFWRSKLQLSPSQFRELGREAKTRAFAVSGIAKGDELATVYGALTNALAQGTPFAEFQRDCAAIFEKRGWTGKRAWRIDNIFRTNIQTAYNVGRYQELQRLKARRPFWRYSAVNDRRTRPAHRAMHGKIFPADHPFWETWYPPNGFRCRCSVDSVSQTELEVNGWQVETKDPTGKLYEPTDPVTGVKLPARLAMPDPGWDFHVGKAGLQGLEMPQSGRWSDLPGLKGPADYRLRTLANMHPATLPDLPVQPLASGATHEAYREAFVARYGAETVLTDPLGDPVLLSLRLFADKGPSAEEWKFTKPGHGEIIPLLGDIIASPLEIWLTPQRSADGKTRLTKRYIAAWKTQDKQRIGGLAVFEVVDGSMQGVTAFMPMRKGEVDLEYLEKQRRGVLLYGKGR